MASTRRPVVFIHGLWLHADSWLPWMELFDSAGYDPIAPGWPGDGDSVVETRLQPERVANRGLDEIADHYAAVLRTLDQPAIAVGHSLGGLIAQKLLGRGLVVAAVAIDPAQMKGVLPLPFAQIQSAFPALGNPANYRRAVALTARQFHRGFASAVTEAESNELHARYAIPGPARPLFEAAFANFKSKTAAKVDVDNPSRGPLLIIGGGKDRTVPEVVTRAEHKLYKNAKTVNDYRVFADRGHSLTIDHGWREIADAALTWLALRGLAPSAERPGAEAHA